MAAASGQAAGLGRELRESVRSLDEQLRSEMRRLDAQILAEKAARELAAAAADHSSSKLCMELEKVASYHPMTCCRKTLGSNAGFTSMRVPSRQVGQSVATGERGLARLAASVEDRLRAAEAAADRADLPDRR